MPYKAKSDLTKAAIKKSFLALLNFAPHPCRERIYPFRFFRGDLAHLRINILRYPGNETTVETVAATRYIRLCYISAKFATALHWLTCQGEQAALLPRG